jgi:hypothetical protein
MVARTRGAKFIVADKFDEGTDVGYAGLDAQTNAGDMIPEDKQSYKIAMQVMKEVQAWLGFPSGPKGYTKYLESLDYDGRDIFKRLRRKGNGKGADRPGR